jgi:hypothetical protein
MWLPIKPLAPVTQAMLPVFIERNIVQISQSKSQPKDVSLRGHVL